MKLPLRNTKPFSFINLFLYKVYGSIVTKNESLLTNVHFLLHMNNKNVCSHKITRQIHSLKIHKILEFFPLPYMICLM